MRNRFANKLTSIAKANDSVVLLSGDIGNRLFDHFKQEFSNRFYNCGVAEQNMAGVAAGLAMQGFLPVIYTIAPFCTARCLEQIKIDIAYHNLPVTIVAVGAGFSYASLGPSHHSCDDIAFLRAIPNIRILAPADPEELSATLDHVFTDPCPTYMRIGKKGEPILHKDQLLPSQISTLIKLAEGKDICLLSSGTIAGEVLKAKEILSKRGLRASVYSMPQIKPINEEAIFKILGAYKFVAAVEEHSKIGGMTSAISDLIVDKRITNFNFFRFGTEDEFFERSGDQQFARDAMGISAEKIAKRILRELKRIKL